jgi:hypothetical protein
VSAAVAAAIVTAKEAMKTAKANSVRLMNPFRNVYPRGPMLQARADPHLIEIKTPPVEQRSAVSGITIRL